jgi:hypothetical protein
MKRFNSALIANNVNTTDEDLRKQLTYLESRLDHIEQVNIQLLAENQHLKEILKQHGISISGTYSNIKTTPNRSYVPSTASPNSIARMSKISVSPVRSPATYSNGIKTSPRTNSPKRSPPPPPPAHYRSPDIQYSSPTRIVTVPKQLASPTKKSPVVLNISPRPSSPVTSPKPATPPPKRSPRTLSPWSSPPRHPTRVWSPRVYDIDDEYVTSDDEEITRQIEAIEERASKEGTNEHEKENSRRRYWQLKVMDKVRFPFEARLRSLDYERVIVTDFSAQFKAIEGSKLQFVAVTGSENLDVLFEQLDFPDKKPRGMKWMAMYPWLY